MEEAREEITATTDIPPQLSTLSRVTDVAIDDPSTFSQSTEYIEQRPPDVIDGEHSAVPHAPSDDVEVPESPTPVLGNCLPIGTLLPLNFAVALSEHSFLSPEPHSQMPATAASGPSRSWNPSAVEGEDRAKATLCQGKGKGEPYNDNTLTSDVSMRQLSLQRTINVADAGLTRSSLDAEHTGEHRSRPRGGYDIV